MKRIICSIFLVLLFFFMVVPGVGADPYQPLNPLGDGNFDAAGNSKYHTVLNWTLHYNIASCEAGIDDHAEFYNPGIGDWDNTPCPSSPFCAFVTQWSASASDTYIEQSVDLYCAQSISFNLLNNMATGSDFEVRIYDNSSELIASKSLSPVSYYSSVGSFGSVEFDISDYVFDDDSYYVCMGCWDAAVDTIWYFDNVSVVYGEEPILVPISNFSAHPTEGVDHLDVSFQDLSLNEPICWLWDFGDGVLSSSQNPVHSYRRAGIYDVSLTASNEAGSDVLVMRNFITVSDGSPSRPPGDSTGPALIIDPDVSEDENEDISEDEENEDEVGFEDNENPDDPDEPMVPGLPSEIIENPMNWIISGANWFLWKAGLPFVIPNWFASVEGFSGWSWLLFLCLLSLVWAYLHDY